MHRGPTHEGAAYAQAFESVHYPILPSVERRSRADPLCPACVDEILQVRHHSLYVPLAGGFDHRALRWGTTALSPTAGFRA